MSILSALKAKGAKGNNIEEAVKSMDFGGSGGGAYPLCEIAKNGEELVGISRVELKELIESSKYSPICFYYRQDGNASYSSTGGYGVIRGTMGQVTGITTVLLGQANVGGPYTVDAIAVTIPFDESESISFLYKKIYLS